MAPKTSKTNKQASAKKASSTKVAAVAKKQDLVITLDDPDESPPLAVSASPSMGSGASSFAPSASLMRNLSPAAVAGPKTSGESSDTEDIAATLGIAVQKKSRAGFGTLSKDSNLKICKLPDAIAFRFQPEDTTGKISSWSEKEMFQALREGAPWVRAAGIDSIALTWFDQNQKMTNNKGYGIRLFIVYLQSNAKLPSDAAIIKLGNFICTNVNQIDGNETTVSVGASPFWPTNKVAVWSDIIGVDAALRKLVKDCGSLTPGFYDQYKHHLYTCFRMGELSMELARMIHAPLDEVHPDLRPIHAKDCMKSAIAADKKKKSNVKKKQESDAMEEDDDFFLNSDEEEL